MVLSSMPDKWARPSKEQRTSSGVPRETLGELSRSFYIGVCPNETLQNDVCHVDALCGKRLYGFFHGDSCI